MTNCFPAFYTIVGDRAVLTGGIVWQYIRWDRVIHRVKSIQSRIVKAVQVQRWNKVKVLQGILSRSYAAKLLAIRRVTENSGKRTAGVDGELWSTPQAKQGALKRLQRLDYKPLPVRRINIPKSNGKMRPLGIPTMLDRAMQALYLLTLEPVSECLADLNSYGFRPPMRSCADAIARCFSLLAKPGSPVWILEGDIKGCFDHISHEWLVGNIPIDTKMLQKWLKSGYLEKRRLYVSKEGTPQGSVISPTLANMVLDGLELAIDQAANVKHWGKNTPKRRINPNHIHLVRYADDFVVTCSDRKILETIIQPAIAAFLSDRGLQLSKEKTTITHIDQGFDFLGQNVRKYKGKLLIQPSKKNVEAFLNKVNQAIKERSTASSMDVIEKLSSMIRGWAMYHQHIVAKQTFSDVDHEIWQMLWRWSRRRHAHKKGAHWVKKRYFMRHLYERQSGCCPICHQKITLQTGYNTHHLHPKHLGGRWSANNLVLVHPVCHVQIHHNPSVAAALTISVSYA
jgi:RNA-directed DNA polymerase